MGVLPRIIWEKTDQKDKLILDGVSMSLSQVSAGMRNLITGLDASLKTKLLLESGLDLEDTDWLDDQFSQAAGYSFFLDPRNSDLVKPRHSLANWISRNPNLEPKFRLYGDWNGPSFKEYLHAADDFLKRLIFLLFVLGGQPPRGSEIAPLLLVNKIDHSRNLYFYKNTICFLFSYNKTGPARYIPRFLPREVSQLFLKYLVYIRPFIV